MPDSTPDNTIISKALTSDDPKQLFAALGEPYRRTEPKEGFSSLLEKLLPEEKRAGMHDGDAILYLLEKRAYQCLDALFLSEYWEAYEIDAKKAMFDHVTKNKPTYSSYSSLGPFYRTLEQLASKSCPKAASLFFLASPQEHQSVWKLSSVINSFEDPASAKYFVTYLESNVKIDRIAVMQSIKSQKTFKVLETHWPEAKDPKAFVVQAVADNRSEMLKFFLEIYQDAFKESEAKQVCLQDITKRMDGGKIDTFTYLLSEWKGVLDQAFVEQLLVIASNNVKYGDGGLKTLFKVLESKISEKTATTCIQSLLKKDHSNFYLEKPSITMLHTFYTFAPEAFKPFILPVLYRAIGTTHEMFVKQLVSNDSLELTKGDKRKFLAQASQSHGSEILQLLARTWPEDFKSNASNLLKHATSSHYENGSFNWLLSALTNQQRQAALEANDCKVLKIASRRKDPSHLLTLFYYLDAQKQQALITRLEESPMHSSWDHKKKAYEAQHASARLLQDPIVRALYGTCTESDIAILHARGLDESMITFATQAITSDEHAQDGRDASICLALNERFNQLQSHIQLVLKGEIASVSETKSQEEIVETKEPKEEKPASRPKLKEEKTEATTSPKTEEPVEQPLPKPKLKIEESMSDEVSSTSAVQSLENMIVHTEIMNPFDQGPLQVKAALKEDSPEALFKAMGYNSAPTGPEPMELHHNVSEDEKAEIILQEKQREASLIAQGTECIKALKEELEDERVARKALEKKFAEEQTARAELEGRLSQLETMMTSLLTAHNPAQKAASNHQQGQLVYPVTTQMPAPSEDVVSACRSPQRVTRSASASELRALLSQRKEENRRAASCPAM